MGTQATNFQDIEPRFLEEAAYKSRMARAAQAQIDKAGRHLAVAFMAIENAIDIDEGRNLLEHNRSTDLTSAMTDLYRLLHALDPCDEPISDKITAFIGDTPDPSKMFG